MKLSALIIWHSQIQGAPLGLLLLQGFDLGAASWLEAGSLNLEAERLGCPTSLPTGLPDLPCLPANWIAWAALDAGLNKQAGLAGMAWPWTCWADCIGLAGLAGLTASALLVKLAGP